jgi:NADPH2:quinone reductase
MRAIQMHQPGGPEVLKLVTLEKPQPAAGEVCVLAEAIGVGRADLLVRRGTYKWMPPLPAIPGTELAGRIESLGQGVNPSTLGQRVLVSARELEVRGGCYSEAICVPAESVFNLPDSIGAADAVSLPNFQLALALFRSAALEQVKTILIPGAAGGVASALTQIGVARGIKVFGTASTAEKAEYAKNNGVSHVVSNVPDDMKQQVMALTGGRGVDIAFDHLGAESLIACIHCLAPMGMAVSYNIVKGNPSADVFQTLRSLLGKSLAVRTFSMHTFDENKHLRRALMYEAIELMASGRIKPTPATVLLLSDIATAHTLHEQGTSLGKIVLKP